MKLTPEEAFVEKRFKQDNFSVIKLDNTNLYKAPDFKIFKTTLTALAEVKVGFKKGKIEERLPSGAFRLDPAQAVEDYFRESNIKLTEYLEHHPKDKNLPYILVFTSPFFIDNELEWSDVPYKKYKKISAVFIPKRTHPLDSKANDMSTEELEALINSSHIPFDSQTKLGWEVIKNPFAKTPLDTVEFKSIVNLKRVIISR